MRMIAVCMLMASLGLVSGCGDSKFKTYRGPDVTGIYVDKSDRKMFLMHGTQALKVYNVSLGKQPVGHKEFEGDGKTPEGTYLIDRRKPDSPFHLSIGISYPNVMDADFAHAQGKEPGGAIVIHGVGRARPPKDLWDWTDGCIAVTDEEMEDVYAMVRNGTPITIVP
ncbi:L,D-transpeptidase family protein [Frigidibacter sp. MR17.14]|uniref:L,D-transpeptidase family protein n=1 Tax=Frigidibacter sp. MR17.14 TaxID=3126509 RepID=UPI003012C5ED